MAPRFGSVVTAMVTPFDASGAVDLETAVSLARHLEGSGSGGIVLAGSTGEGPVLSDDEKVALFAAVKAGVSIPILAATGSNDTVHSARLSKAAQDVGVDGLLVVTPYYNRPSSVGLEAHFKEIANSTSLPILLYDVPIRTGRRIGSELIIELSKVPNIVGVKDATGDVAEAARIVAETPDDYLLYCGDDSLTLPFLSIGAVGIISVASHWAGTGFAEMISLHRAGDVAGAQRVNARLQASYDFESTPEFPNPMPAKAACRAMGFAVGNCRLPNAPAPAALDDEAALIVKNSHDLFPASRSFA